MIIRFGYTTSNMHDANEINNIFNVEKSLKKFYSNFGYDSDAIFNLLRQADKKPLPGFEGTTLVQELSHSTLKIPNSSELEIFAYLKKLNKSINLDKLFFCENYKLYPPLKFNHK